MRSIGIYIQHWSFRLPLEQVGAVGMPDLAINSSGQTHRYVLAPFAELPVEIETVPAVLPLDQAEITDPAVFRGITALSDIFVEYRLVFSHGGWSNTSLGIVQQVGMNGNGLYLRFQV